LGGQAGSVAVTGHQSHLDHPYRQALAAPSEPGRSAAVRDAMDIPQHRFRHRALLGVHSLGRFAAAHKTMYGQTPLQALRAAH